jgi:UDPglucose 6-dehydrogenase/GDP-mannose 6-dehydrogenase
MKISVIGTGYVGLVSGVCMAEKGHSVTCVDVDEEKVKKINNAISPIHERGLDELLKKNVNKTFTVTTNLREAVMNTDLSIIAVGTPFNCDRIDLSSVKQAARELGKVFKSKDSYHAIIVKSTVVPGTTDDVILPIIEKTSEKKAGVDFGIGMNPEFLREGEAISDFMNPDRIVLGAIDEQTLAVMEKAYEVFKGVDIVKTNNRTAEMIKYTANSLLATMISFSNEIGNLCANVNNVDVTEVMQGVLKDRRLSPLLPNGERIKPGFISYLAAGCGFGGSCFPKDVKALIAYGKEKKQDMKLLESVININDNQPKQVLALLEKHYEDLSDLPVAILGLAFKPGTNDMRESPAIPVIKHLLNNGARVKAYDPVAQQEAQKIFGNKNIEYPAALAECVEGAKVVIVLTAWDEFKEKVPQLMENIDPQPLFIDGRRIFLKHEFEKYEGIGLHQCAKRKKVPSMVPVSQKI